MHWKVSDSHPFLRIETMPDTNSNAHTGRRRAPGKHRKAIASPSSPPQNLAVDITLPVSASRGGTNHRVPNTGDLISSFTIHITTDNFTSLLL
jgi:hypothetical protein